MIKLPAINRIKFIFSVAGVFLACYILKMNFILVFFLLSLAAYLKFRNIKNCNLLHLALLFVFGFVINYAVAIQHLPFYLMPFSLVPMLAMILFNDLELSLVLNIASSLGFAFIAGGDLPLAVLSFISGVSSSIFILFTRRRVAIIKAGALAGFIQAFVFFFLTSFRINAPLSYLILFFNGIVSSIIVAGILPVFEYLFKTVTNISLLELADFNHPLLQRLTQEAPGTYHHSLIVGNLSDAAARSVNANALLSRIGAYYHDIGKLAKPGYFSENQDKESKHEALSPSMSKMIIVNHVKEGMELAKKYKLNPALIDFIQQHHGNSLVYYFYRRALEHLEDDEEIKEEGFRYPGPKPATKETAIVLLADSVEAAARGLKEPTPAKIEELVHKVVNNKFIDGQLDSCDLTLKDLEKISAVFIRILSGIYHSRVTYPEGEKSENNHNKPAKENSHPSQKDKFANH